MSTEAPPAAAGVEPGTFDATWDFAALSNAVCDVLVEHGKIRVKPAFIRGDRQAKIAEVRKN